MTEITTHHTCPTHGLYLFADDCPICLQQAQLTRITTTTKLKQLPKIKEAFILITADGGGLNRYRSQDKILEEAEAFLSTRAEDLPAIDRWLGLLGEGEFEEFLCGDQDIAEEIGRTGPTGAHALFNDYFNEA